MAFGLAPRNAPICGSSRLLLGSRSVWPKGLRGFGPAHLSRRDTDLDVDYRQKNTSECESGRSSDEIIKEKWSESGEAGCWSWISAPRVRSRVVSYSEISVQVRYYSSVQKQAVVPVNDTREKAYSFRSVSSKPDALSS